MVFTGVLVLLQAALVATQWVAQLSGVDLVALYPDAGLVLPGSEEIVLATVFAAGLLLLQIGVVRRSRWARIALMAVFTADAFARLTVATSMTGGVAHSLLVGAGASALGVLAISSDASRQWVQTLRLDSQSLEADEDGDEEAEQPGRGAVTEE